MIIQLQAETHDCDSRFEIEIETRIPPITNNVSTAILYK